MGEYLKCLVSIDGGKVIEKFRYAASIDQIVKKGLNRHTRTAKNGHTTHNIWIGMNTRYFFHNNLITQISFFNCKAIYCIP